MTFGEKLIKLRKEKGFSQEVLAEKLSTTRQAISKWENDQGFPETEKLIMIGDIFGVSIDYLLKATVEQNREKEEGYFVSKEMAEGYLLNQRKTAKYLALGICLLISTIVPYLAFGRNPIIQIPIIIMFAMLGIGMLVTADIIEEDSYNILTREVLMFDQKFLKELTVRYETIKKKYTAIIIAGYCLMALGGLVFGLEEIIVSGVLVSYYPVSVVLIAVGFYMILRTSSILEAYQLMVKNEEHTNRLVFKLKQKFRKKVEDFLG